MAFHGMAVHGMAWFGCGMVWFAWDLRGTVLHDFALRGLVLSSLPMSEVPHAAPETEPEAVLEESNTSNRVSDDFVFDLQSRILSFETPCVHVHH